MVGPGAVVTQRHRGEGTDEDRTGVAHPAGPGGGVAGLHLQVLGAVGVHHGQPLLEVVDQHDPGLLAAERGADPGHVTGRGDLLVELGLDLVGQRGRGGDQHRRRRRVVLGLADQVGRDEGGHRGVVGEDGDLGRAGLGVDADHALEQSLRGDGVDVAGPGDQVDPAARAGAVGEHRDGLGAADGVHLLDAEQRARRQDRRVRQAGVLGLRGRGERDRGDARHLRGYDVHHHARHQRGDASGDVEPDPLDRHHPLGDRAAGHDLRDDVRLQLRLTAGAQPADRLLQPGADLRVQGRQRVGQGLLRHLDVGLLDVVERRGVLRDRLDPAMADGVADRPDDVESGLDVEVGARHHGAVVGVLAGALPPQVDPANHAPSVGRLTWCPTSCPSFR